MVEEADTGRYARLFANHTATHLQGQRRAGVRQVSQWIGVSCMCMVGKEEFQQASNQARDANPRLSCHHHCTCTHMHVQVDHVAALQHALKETDGIGSTTACLASMVPGA